MLKDKIETPTRRFFRVSHMTVSREISRMTSNTAKDLNVEHRVVVLDNEKYFTFANSEMKGNDEWVLPISLEAVT